MFDCVGYPLNGIDLHRALASRDLAAVVKVLNSGYVFILQIYIMLGAI